jgi:hypothetical protein
VALVTARISGAMSGDSQAPDQPEGAETATGSSLNGSLRAWLANLRGLSRDYTLLALLEMQRAGIGLALLLAACVVVAVLVVTAWTALVAGAIAWAIQSGTSWPLALVGAAAVNLAIAGLMVMEMRARLGGVFLGATLRQLRGEGQPVEGQ